MNGVRIAYGPGLHTLLSNIALFAHTDELLPAINVVHLQTTGGLLTATATDRYTIATDGIDFVEGKLAPVSVDLAGLKRVLRNLRGFKGEVTLARRGGLLRVQAGPDSYGLSIRSLKFPNVSQIFDTWHDDLAAEGVGVASILLARFSKVVTASRYTPLRVWFYGSVKPVHIKIGPSFHGLIMPVRPHSEGAEPFVLTIPARTDVAA